MKEIVKDPSNRFDWWIMKTFNVLPTSPEFQNLTEMERDFIWQSYLEDNPKLRQQIENIQYDDDFNDEWDSLAPDVNAEGQTEYDDNDTSEEEDDLSEMAERAYESLQKDERTKLEPVRERLSQKGIKLGDVVDWEEVDDEGGED